jgi:hypothetical protein
MAPFLFLVLELSFRNLSAFSKENALVWWTLSSRGYATLLIASEFFLWKNSYSSQNFVISMNMNEADQVIKDKPVRASRPARNLILPKGSMSP